MRIAASRGLVLTALAVLAGGTILGGALLPATLRLDAASGNWRAASLGLRRAEAAGTLAMGRRALVHFHGPGVAGATLTLAVSARSQKDPVLLRVVHDSRTLFSLVLSERATRVEVAAPPDRDGLDVILDLEPRGPDARAACHIHAIELRRPASPVRRCAQVLPACLALLVLWLAWRRCPALALAWCAVVLAGGIGALMVAWDAPALLLLPAGTGPVLRFLGLAVVVTLALLRPAPAASAAAVVFVVGLVHLPSLHYGFVNEDFDFARRVGAAELTGTLHGSWDPRGIVEPYLRPLVAASLALDHRLWGGRPPGYHLTSLLIFAAAGLVAVALLRRLGLSPRAALAGALFWLVHPLAASAAAWPNQRTDSLAAVFYLGALLTLLHPAFPRRRAAACLGLGVLALACKEMAVTLPFAAYAVVQTGLPPDARRGRRLALAALLLLVAAYTIVWTSIFPERLADRLHGESSWGANAGIGLRSLAALYTQLLVPSDYESWWNQPLDQRSWLVLAAGPLVALLAAALVRSSRSAHAWRLLLLGLAWPLLTVWPLLAIREVDLFRLGFLLCLGSGILVGALFAGFESRRLWLPVAVTTALILLWVPASIRSAAAWGPGGLMSRQLGLWRAHRGTTWWQGLTPEMQRLYYEQRGLEGHEQTLLEAPVRDAAPPSD